MNDETKILAERRHAILSDRYEQLTRNLKAWRGGNPYIDARLYRAPNESDVSWLGDGKTISGRRTRAFLLNDAGRVVQKINQYLFAEPAARAEIDEDWSKDVCADGTSIDDFWQQVNEIYTSAGWVWLNVDRGAPEVDEATGRPRARSVAQREAAGDRVYWNLWQPDEVVDWSFDAQGGLVWLLTSETRYDNANPLADAKRQQLRTLWRAATGGATFQRYLLLEDGKVQMGDSGAVSTPEIPFMLVGKPSALPWWFDDVEMIQQVLMNLANLHNENLVKTVYPQLVVASGMVADLQTRLVERYGQDGGARIVEMTRELIRGLDRPFVESAEDNGITRYLQPSASDLKAIPEYHDNLRRQLFDAVGLGLFNKESRQVQSAESKQFDQLDTEATLRHRANVMQEAEEKLVAMTKRIDGSFREYRPVWPQSFDVPHMAEDVAALTQIANFADLTPTIRRSLLRTAVATLDRISKISDEDRLKIEAEIEALDEGAVENPAIDVEA